MVENLAIIIVFVFLIVVVFFFFGAFFMLLEDTYSSVFNKPFYIHFYPFPKKLTSSQSQVLSDQFYFYKKLSPKKKQYFEHRVASFIDKYSFYGKDKLVVSEEMKVLIAATSAMLTFGMRTYLYTVFDKVILYPDIYFSQTTKLYHKGEFNPSVKALVFSWKHFQEGYELANDNLNLGLHEFSHILQYQSLKSIDASAIIYRNNYEKLLREVKHPSNSQRLINSDYIRNYAFTNEFEFMAVILEHFFETPNEFKHLFPELYQNVKTMINYKELE
ncbi:MAG: zinc-dependent peptidase [Flavobacterium sp.]